MAVWFIPIIAGGRVALPIILRYIAKHGAKKAAKKYGNNAVKTATKTAKNYKGKDKSILSAIKNFFTFGKTATTKTLTKIVVKGGKRFKVKYAAKTAKGKAILKKVLKTAKPKPTKLVKGRPVKVAKPKPTKIAKPKPTKLVKGKPVKVAKPKPTKIAKPKPTKIAKPKPTKIAKPKPTKTAKPKPTKVAKPKPTKIAKPKPTKIAKPTAKLKTKPFWTKGKIIGGAITAGTIAGLLLTKKKPDKKGIIPEIRKKPDAPRDRPGPQSGPQVKTKLKDIPGSSQYKPMPTGPQVKTKFTEAREKSFEDRVRALVAQKDRLKKIPAGDGVRSEYQVRMHKLKKENKKAWKKLFTMGGKLK